ncbi:hypothetical protein QM012_004121 [Aureobasidium pullulans]|uniref:Uncharacterized protein n=1 Tax=Aureobasidium pullulans TaxID=5580 RepID=A0ABR0T6S5_AURPU
MSYQPNTCLVYYHTITIHIQLPIMSNEQSRNAVLPTTAIASDPAEISGLREQIFGNAAALFPTRTHIDIIVASAEWPESGYYGARLVDISNRVLLLGSLYAPSITEALSLLLQETCDEVRDSFVLSHYRSL